MQKPFTKNYHICIFMTNFRSCFWELTESVVTNSVLCCCWTTDWVSLISPCHDAHYWGNGRSRAWQVAKYYECFLYIGLMTWCHESLHLENIPSWSRLKRAHYVSKTLWSFRNHNKISASTEKILKILKWIWSSELQNYCKKLAEQQVNKIHILINCVWFCTQNTKIIFLKV